MDYANLHVHSEHSLLDGAAKIKDLAKSSAAAGHKYLALTDHGSINGAIRHKKACEANGIKPLYGCELFMAENFDEDGIEATPENLHLTVIAKDRKGFELLLKGLNHANLYGEAKKGKAKRAFLPTRWPITAGWAGHVVILSGCANSPFWKMKNAEASDTLLAEYIETFKDDFYGEMMPLHDWETQGVVNQAVYEEVVQKHRRKYVATNDIHYCRADDADLHELILAIGSWRTWNDPNRWKFSTHQNFIRPPEEMIDSLVQMGLSRPDSEIALRNTLEVAEKCAFKLEPTAVTLPPPYPAGVNETAKIIELCEQGLTERGLIDQPGYVARLSSELNLLVDKDFTRYLLIVAEAVSWAKQNGIFVGPGRGSVSGSLVAYALRITEIDPIAHGLSFDRFVAQDRIDLPDIDLDIEDRRRGMVEAHLKVKYGDERIAHVSAYGTMLGRAAIREVSKVFEVPFVDADRMSKTIIKVHESDPRAHNTIEDTIKGNSEAKAFATAYPRVVKMAQALEGQIRAGGVHAAGFVISDHDLRVSDRCHLTKNKESLIVNWDKDDLEFMGIMKLDLLGLATHSVISECLSLIERRHQKKIVLADLKLDDQEVFASIGRGETATLFQLNTPGPTGYCRELKPENFDDLAAIAALWKPGPIKAGITEAYVAVRHGGKDETAAYGPGYGSITKSTRRQIVYQEQIVQLLVELAGFSWAEADRVRKIVSKREGFTAWDEYADRFVAGCEKLGTMDADNARELWKRLNLFALYAFNKSHAVAYGLVAYWTAWLKFHYPAEYLCAYLSEGSTERESADGVANINMALAEAGRLSIKVLGPDINKSSSGWSVESDKALRAGLQEVRFVGDKAREELGRAKGSGRQFADIPQLVQSVRRQVVNKKTIKALLFSGAFDEILGDQDVFWKVDFDTIYEVINKPEKMARALDNAAIMVNQADAMGQKALDERKSEWLNYDVSAVTAAEQIPKQIAEVMGGSVVELPGGKQIEIGGKLYPMSDAMIAQFPGLPRSPVHQTKAVAGMPDLIERTIKCEACDLRKDCRRPVPIQRGEFNVMIVAEAPGGHEDQRGTPLVGDAGRELWTRLAEIDITRALVWVDNAVHCRPKGNKMDEAKVAAYIKGCTFLGEAIELVKPVAILALGNKALCHFTGRTSGITQFNGQTAWNTKYRCWVTYCLHPSNVLCAPERERDFVKGLNEFGRVFQNLIGIGEESHVSKVADPVQDQE